MHRLNLMTLRLTPKVLRVSWTPDSYCCLLAAYLLGSTTEIVLHAICGSGASCAWAQGLHSLANLADC